VLGWDRAFAAAIEQARDGVPVVPSLAESIAREAEALYIDPGCREVFLRGGAPLREGDLLRQPALAASLERLAAEGPETFYHGPLGRAVVAGLRARGSRLDLADLAGFVPERVAPVAARFGEVEVASAPANSQGFLMPSILAAAERLGDGLDPLGPDAGRLASIFRASLAVRERYLGDPLAVDPEVLAAAAEADLLGWLQASPRTPPRGNGDTVAIVAADAEGNTVSLLQSLFHAFGSAGALEMRGETELLVSDLDGRVERIEHAPIDKERAELEDFADAIAQGRRFVIAPEEIVNGVAAMQAIAESARQGAPVSIV